MFNLVKDAEAAVYAIESAILLVESVGSNNWGQAVLDLVSLYGWIRNAT